MKTGIVKKKNRIYSYKDILAYPSKGDTAKHCPQDSKCYAEWWNRKRQMWDSSQEGYFNKWFSSMLKPSETIFS